MDEDELEEFNDYRDWECQDCLYRYFSEDYDSEKEEEEEAN